MPGTWTLLANRPPFAASVVLLLTDGTVMLQEETAKNGGVRWCRLRPDRLGSYQDGTWELLAPMSVPRWKYASAVLRDGRVLVAGGEVEQGPLAEEALTAVEIYDPVADHWKRLPPFTLWPAISDAPCCLLPNGRLLLGAVSGPQTAVFDPVTETWVAGGSKPDPADSSKEETWTLLSDGSVLTVECSRPPGALRYLPGPNEWVAAGDTDPLIVDTAATEIGPALLCYDGSVFAIGANGATSIFIPAAVGGADRWQAGPSFPATKDGRFPTMAAKDTPACLLPNGMVLLAAGPPAKGAADFPPPTYFLEFDGSSLVEIDPPPNDDRTIAACDGQFLILPTGEALFINCTDQVALYRPAGKPDPAWAPQIAKSPSFVAVGSVYELYGRQLNGLSQAVSYGDDLSAATNYPIVQLRGGDGSIYYCRTFDHSTMGVATGTAIHSTRFWVPWDVPPGEYELRVIANGIASDPHGVTVDDCTAKTPPPS